eukprot:CAMPEP_0202857714 /NCGR_PEP_ID=MMETSP1391-20130828/549_1 /ASSEMBLY_ACC=CAM_ASM_000867 /TAXON_ID=1034604 /ORGANISM="Chlamydomonas leiostraca, Strain SAG 11-49" /LENGTH=62 /DNA_ID=CAMNT_0049536553 /DNA_START=129 /DNA_END=314 /DNA_ORIENTATION=+
MGACKWISGIMGAILFAGGIAMVVLGAVWLSKNKDCINPIPTDAPPPSPPVPEPLTPPAPPL